MNFERERQENSLEKALRAFSFQRTSNGGMLAYRDALRDIGLVQAIFWEELSQRPGAMVTFDTCRHLVGDSAAGRRVHNNLVRTNMRFLSQVVKDISAGKVDVREEPKVGYRLVLTDVE